MLEEIYIENLAVIEKAEKNKVLNKILEVEVPVEIYEELKKFV